MHESVRADEAGIQSARASLESDRAAVETAKLNLSFCEIRSPVAGRAGNVLVHAGNLVKANGDNALVVINQIEPIFVSFAVPEHHLAAVRSKMSDGRKLEVEASPGDAPGKIVHGNLTVIDNAVDSTTGTIKLKAVFDNRERALWPGQFVNVVLKLETSEETVVPSEAVQSGQQGQYLYVVTPDKTVQLRPVAVGSTVNGKTIVEKGVAGGRDGRDGRPIAAVPGSANPSGSGQPRGVADAVSPRRLRLKARP